MAVLPEGRYRWWDDGHPPQKIASRPQPARDCGVGREEHVHIHLYDANAGAVGEGGATGGLPPAKRSQTTAPPSAGFDGDQEEEPGGRRLPCRLMQQGEDWRAVDGEGNELQVVHGSDGALEIHTIHHPNGGSEDEAGDAAPSGKLGLFNPAGSHEPTGSKKPPMGAPGLTGDAYDQAMLKAFRRDGRARGGPGAEIAANRAWSREIADYYSRR